MRYIIRIAKEKNPQTLNTTILDKKNIEPKDTHKKLNILIAEDINYNQILLKTMLSEFGYEKIDIANDGNETIDKITNAIKENNDFDIVLLDLRMPNMNGYECIIKLKTMLKTLPKIVAVTASVSDEDRELCKKLGIDYFISKPVEMTELKNILLRISEHI